MQSELRFLVPGVVRGKSASVEVDPSRSQFSMRRHAGEPILESMTQLIPRRKTHSPKGSKMWEYVLPQPSECVAIRVKIRFAYEQVCASESSSMT